MERLYSSRKGKKYSINAHHFFIKKGSAKNFVKININKTSETKNNTH